MTLLVAVFGLASNAALMIWITSCLIIANIKYVDREPPGILRDCYHELRPFYWPATVCSIAADVYPHGFIVYVADWVHWVNLTTAWLAWLVLKDLDDDDRWKRRKRELAEAVKRIGGRLVVISIPAGA